MSNWVRAPEGGLCDGAVIPLELATRVFQGRTDIVRYFELEKYLRQQKQLPILWLCDNKNISTSRLGRTRRLKTALKTAKGDGRDRATLNFTNTISSACKQLPIPLLLESYGVELRELPKFLQALETHARTSSQAEIVNPTTRITYRDFSPRLHPIVALQPQLTTQADSLARVTWLYEAFQQYSSYRLTLNTFAPYNGDFKIAGYSFEHKYNWWWDIQSGSINFPASQHRRRSVFHSWYSWDYIFAESAENAQSKRTALCIPRDHVPTHWWTADDSSEELLHCPFNVLKPFLVTLKSQQEAVRTIQKLIDRYGSPKEKNPIALGKLSGERIVHNPGDTAVGASAVVQRLHTVLLGECRRRRSGLVFMLAGQSPVPVGHFIFASYRHWSDEECQRYDTQGVLPLHRHELHWTEPVLRICATKVERALGPNPDVRYSAYPGWETVKTARSNPGTLLLCTPKAYPDTSHPWTVLPADELQGTSLTVDYRWKGKRKRKRIAKGNPLRTASGHPVQQYTVDNLELHSVLTQLLESSGPVQVGVRLVHNTAQHIMTMRDIYQMYSDWAIAPPKRDGDEDGNDDDDEDIDDEDEDINDEDDDDEGYEDE
ncbi:MAG: hypothetical protein Q9187_006608 [Circinaria calcarea]